MIRIDGHLGGTVLSAFLAPAPEQRGARIVLAVLLDQSALYGVLEEIGALVLDLLDIRKLTQNTDHQNTDHQDQGTATRLHDHYLRPPDDAARMPPPDPVLLDQFWDFADKYGICRDELITRMDGGP
jgi:hypothetical protein